MLNVMLSTFLKTYSYGHANLTHLPLESVHGTFRLHRNYDWPPAELVRSAKSQYSATQELSGQASTPF